MNKKITAFILLSLVFCGFANSASYIKSNETITIQIKGVPQAQQVLISSDYVIDGKGNLFMPFISEGIKASGLSSSALARRIETAYKDAEIYTTPRITIVTARDEAERKTIVQTVTVGGKVARPGPVPYQEGMTLYEAVFNAGDATPFGAMGRVELLRKGKRSVHNLKSSDSKDRILQVYPKDVITVPQTNHWGR